MGVVVVSHHQARTDVPGRRENDGKKYRSKKFKAQFPVFVNVCYVQVIAVNTKIKINI